MAAPDFYIEQKMKSLLRPTLAWSCLFALLSLTALSCSGQGKLNEVRGKVLHKNQPLSGALVTLHPKGDKKNFKAIPSTGLTKEDGTFTLSTGKKDGVPAGEYTVTIICSREVGGGDKKIFSTGGPESEDVLKGTYADRETSKLTVTIKDGPNQLEPFDLK
jgi:hypothetical protein